MKISIVGQITDYKADGCFCPEDLKEILEGVSENEPLEVEITSEGGSVFAGIQIANMLSRHNGLVATHAVGLCASIATVILMAGSKISVDENCFCLVHRPFSYCEGNANDMEKEIDTLKKCEAAMMGYYRKHSKVADEVLSKYINDETWFLGTEFAEVFDCEVIACDQRFDIAAKCDLTKFNKIDQRILDMEKKNEEVSAQTETMVDGIANEVEVSAKSETSAESEVIKNEVSSEQETPETSEDEKKEDDVEQVSIEEYEKKIEELTKELDECKKKLAEYEEEDDETVSKAECEKRVSGMQASMQKQINDFNNQLKTKCEELKSAHADITSLKQKLDDTNGELSKMASALEEKTKALDMLNSNVNAPSEELPTMEEGLKKCQSPLERVAFLKSGKYVR